MIILKRIQAVSASRILGASKIIGVDINELKRDKAIAFGVTEFMNPKHSDKTISQLILEATGGLGVDYCIECTGAPSLLDQAIASTKAVSNLNQNTTHLSLLQPMSLY